jgi:hypothetical protein
MHQLFFKKDTTNQAERHYLHPGHNFRIEFGITINARI